MIKIIEKTKHIGNGGVEAVMFGTTLRITNDKLQFFYCSDNTPTSDKWLKAAKKAKRKIFCFKRRFSSELLCRMAYIADFYFLCRQQRFDILHLHMYGSYDIAYAAAARLGGVKKIILHSHIGSGGSHTAIKKFFRAVTIPFTGLFGDVFIACSENAAEYMFPPWLRKKCIMLKNGVDTSRFRFDAKKRAEARKKLGIDNCFAAGHIGRLSYEKNQSFLLDIFSEIKKLRNDAVLLLAGSGELENELKEKAKKLGISDSVIFLGSVDDTEYIYNAMDCFILPSEFEGLSVAAVEAQTSGLVTVCSDNVSKLTAITQLCSFISLKSSPKQWAEHILKECSRYTRKDHSQKIISAGYDLDTIAEELQQIYYAEK